VETKAIVQKATTSVALGIRDMKMLAKELAESSMVPTCYYGQPENIIAALQLGSELGIKPMVMLSNSFPVGNKIGFSTDLMVGLAKKHPEWGGMKVVEKPDSCTVTIKRIFANGVVDEATSMFSVAMARQAGIWKVNGAWDKYANRMCKHRATGFALRDVFPDVLAGMYTKEELEAGNFDAEEATDKLEDATLPDDVVLGEAEVIDEGPKDEQLAALNAAMKEKNYATKAVQMVRTRWREVRNASKRVKDSLFKVLMEEITGKKS